MSANQSQDLSRRLLRDFAKPAALLLRHPVTTLLLGVGLFVVGMIELLEGLFENFETVVETYHGFLLFGLVTVLRGLMELLEASEFFAINEAEFETVETEQAEQPFTPPSGKST
jgi:hypothetical protein